MKKEKIHLEYLLNATSKNILWAAISTPTGLEDWFADKVISDDKIVEFHWGKTEQRKAEITAIRSFSFIRFRWEVLFVREAWECLSLYRYWYLSSIISLTIRDIKWHVTVNGSCGWGCGQVVPCLLH